MSLALKLQKIGRNLKRFLMDFDEPKEIPSTVGLVAKALNRSSLDQVLPYQYFEEDTNLFFLDQNNEMVTGFGFVLNPMLIQGDSLAESINGLIGKMPEGAVLTSMVYSSPVVGYLLDNWEGSKNHRQSIMSTKLVQKRKQFIEQSSLDYSLTKNSKMHSRDYHHLFFVRYPFKGHLSDKDDIVEYMDRISDLQKTVQGNLKSAGLSPSAVTPEYFHYLMWHILNPQKVYDDQRVYQKLMEGVKPTAQNLIHKSTRVRVTSKSNLVFQNGGADVNESDVSVEVVPMTVDEYPEFLPPQAAGALIGELVDKDSRISAPFLLYTNIEIVNADKSRKNIAFKKFVIQKQLVSESDFAKNNFAEMFRRRDDATTFLDQTKGKNRPVRVMTGINVFTKRSSRNIDLEEVENIFKKQGYRVSPEPFIGVPVYLSSLPLSYDPKVDKPNSGLQRGQMMTSFNAACAGHYSGEWKGTPTVVPVSPGDPPGGGGMLMAGPKGQIGAIDIFNSPTNYNGIAIGTSGAGKSFWMAEIATDIFCRNGVVRIADVGRSYYNLCENLGGQNVVFDTANPISLNPFWGVEDKETFDKLAEFWRDLLVMMAYPGGRDSESWEYRFIQESVSKGWFEHGAKLELSKIVNTMIELNKEKFENDPRGEDVIYQLSPFADPLGVFYPWFSGPCQLKMDNDFMVFELDELGVTPELKAIVLMMVTNQIERELYLSERDRWRLTIIDEAYDLLRDLRVGTVIEYLFRKARKYRGSCIVGTQSFADMYFNEATKGVIANAGWKFILKQESSSSKKAFDEAVVDDTEFMRKIISEIQPGDDYGELFVKAPHGFDVLYRFVTDPYSFYTYSSKDTAKVQAIAKNMMENDSSLTKSDATALAIEQLSDVLLENRSPA